MKRLEVSDFAMQDQEEMIDFYATREGSDLAVRYFQALRRAFSLIVAKPHLGSARGFRAAELRGVRWFPLKSPFQKHLVFYLVTRETVEIIRVLHASRNIEEILEDQS
jgi:plasmid stabilization system protein ParE